MAEGPSSSALAPAERDLASLALPLPEQAQLDELDATWRWLEARALRGIADTLTRHGLFTSPESAHRLAKMYRRWPRRGPGDVCCASGYSV